VVVVPVVVEAGVNGDNATVVFDFHRRDERRRHVPPSPPKEEMGLNNTPILGQVCLLRFDLSAPL
jgi:hypothetical protein